MPNIVVAAVCFTVIIILLVVVLVLQAVRQAYYAPVPSVDVEQGEKEVKPRPNPTGYAERDVVPLITKDVVPPPGVATKEDNIAERTEEDDDSPDGVAYPVCSYSGFVPQEFRRMAAVPRIGDWSISPFNRRAAALAVVRQKTPYGRFRLGKKVDSPVKFSSNFEAFEFPKDVWIVYGADRAATAGDALLSPEHMHRLHPLERQYIWCNLLAVTGIAPLVHFLSGETRFMSAAGEMSDRFIIMENVGIPIKVMFAKPSLARCVEIVRATIRCLRSVHKMGVVVGSVSTATVFVKGDDVVSLTDLSRAEPIGSGAMTQPWEDVWAAVQMAREALAWKESDGISPIRRKIKDAVDKASNLAKSDDPPYEQILTTLGESIW